MRCTQNKFTIFFIGVSLLGRVGSSHENLGSGRDGKKKVTHVQLCAWYMVIIGVCDFVCDVCDICMCGDLFVPAI